MLEELWTSILDLISQLVIPDWGVIIGFIPVLIIVLVVVVLLWLFRRLATAPPPRRGKQRLRRATPAGIHMPGPSWAPVFGGVGLFLLFLGLVFGGVPLILGAIALSLTLLYWLAEGLRIYDIDTGETTTTRLPAVVDEGPPPGVHMPGPSWRPFLGALGMFALLLGLVFGGWLLAAGVIVLISTLIGWLADALVEYRRTVEADSTGHLDSGGATVDAVAAADRADFSDRRGRGAPVGHLRHRARERRDGHAGRIGRARPCSVGRRRVAGAGIGRSPAGKRPARGRGHHGEGPRLHADDLDGARQQAVHDRVLQRGPEHPPQHRAQGFVERLGLARRRLQRRRDAGLPGPGPACRHLPFPVHRPHEHDGDGDTPVGGR